MVLGIGYCLRFNFLFRFLKSIIKRTRFDLVLACAKDGAPHSELLGSSRNHSSTKRSTSFLKNYSCTFGTGYGLKHIGFTYSFNLNSTESVFRVPSVTSNNSSNICNNFSN